MRVERVSHDAAITWALTTSRLDPRKRVQEDKFHRLPVDVSQLSRPQERAMAARSLVGNLLPVSSVSSSRKVIWERVIIQLLQQRAKSARCEVGIATEINKPRLLGRSQRHR
jgi:hypothetical protein